MIYDNWIEYQYFVSSSLTAFSLRTMREVDAQILIGQLSYQQIAEIINHVHYRSSKHHVQLASINFQGLHDHLLTRLFPIISTGHFDRYKLDRRIELSCLQFAALQVSTWYPENFDRNTPAYQHGSNTLKNYRNNTMTNVNILISESELLSLWY